MSAATPEQIYNQAEEAATLAIRKYFMNGGREAPFNCGFAWVDVNPARGPFISWCKANGKGSKGYPKGWSFWGPGEWPTAEEAGVPTIYGQDMSVKAAGARAFAEVLRSHGIDAYSATRLD